MKAKLVFCIFVLLSYTGMLSAQSFGYVTDYDGSKISIVDLETNKVVGYVDTGTFNIRHPIDVLFTPDGTKAYVVVDTIDAVYRIDPTLNKIVGQINTNGFPFNAPSAIDITPDGTKAYVTNEGGNNVSIIDLSNDTVTGYVNNGGNPFDVPVELAITENGLKCYVINFAGDSVSIINVVTDTVTGYVTTGVFPFDGADQVEFTPTKAYVTNNGGDNVSIINLATDTVTGYINDGGHPFGEPHGVFFTTDFKTALIADFGLGKVSVVDVATDAVTQYVNGVFDRPLNMQFTFNNKFCYVTDYDANNVPIIDLTSFSVVGTVAENGFPFIGPFAIDFSPIIAPPPPPIITPNPPTHLRGEKMIGVSPPGVNYVNILRWRKPVGNVVPLFYQIYRDRALTKLAGIIYSNQRLRFDDFHRKPDRTYQYFVVAVYSDGQVSQPAHIQVVWK